MYNQQWSTNRKSFVFFNKSFKTACFSRRISSRSCAYAKRRGDEKLHEETIYRNTLTILVVVDVVGHGEECGVLLHPVAEAAQQLLVGVHHVLLQQLQLGKVLLEVYPVCAALTLK